MKFYKHWVPMKSFLGRTDATRNASEEEQTMFSRVPCAARKLQFSLEVALEHEIIEQNISRVRVLCKFRRKSPIGWEHFSKKQCTGDVQRSLCIILDVFTR